MNEQLEMIRKICDSKKHKNPIRADEVLVLNVDGYIGDSTRSEIEYAEANGKPVRYLQPLNEKGQR